MFNVRKPQLAGDQAGEQGVAEGGEGLGFAVIGGDALFYRCRIPDDYISKNRYPLFMARAVMRGLIESLQSLPEGSPC